jgi:small subunit ribosomal protein S18
MKRKAIVKRASDNSNSTDRQEGRTTTRSRKKLNPLALAQIETVTFHDVQLLKYFVSERGRILPRRMTGVSAVQQRMIARAVKQARSLALLPTLRHD